jgi:hypothetical protein
MKRTTHSRRPAAAPQFVEATYSGSGLVLVRLIASAPELVDAALGVLPKRQARRIRKRLEGRGK